MTDVRMDRHGNVKVLRSRKGTKARRRWLDREVDRYRAGLLDLEGLAEVVLSELGWKGGDGSGHYGHAGRPGQVGGSAPAGEYIAISKEQRRAARIGIKDVLEHGLKTGREGMVLIDKDGNRLNGMIQGTEEFVEIPEDLIQDAEIMVHNHPTDGTFSGADISQLFTRRNLKHLLVIGHGGTLYRASLPDYFTMAHRGEFLFRGVMADWGRAVEKYRPEYNRRISLGRESGKVNRELLNIAMQDLARKRGFEYRRVLS